VAHFLLKPVFHTLPQRVQLWVRILLYSLIVLIGLGMSAKYTQAGQLTEQLAARSSNLSAEHGRVRQIITARHAFADLLQRSTAAGVDVSSAAPTTSAVQASLKAQNYTAAETLLRLQTEQLQQKLREKVSSDALAAEAAAAAEAKRGTMVGVVREGSTALANVTLTLRSGDTTIATASSGADGSYSFRQDAGTYTLIAQLSGYDIRTMQEQVITAGQSLDPGVVLSKTPPPTPSPTLKPVAKSTAAPVPAAAAPTVSTNDSTAYSTYARTTVQSDRGSFVADVMTFDLGSGRIRVVADTANDATCANNCPVLPVRTFVQRNGGFAGINGTYFCPTAYGASCAGQTNSFVWKILNGRNGVMINGETDLGFWDSFYAFDTSGRATFFRQWDSYPISGMTAFTGFSSKPLLVYNGTFALDDGLLDDKQRTAKISRAAIGLKGQTFYAVTIQGATVTDMASVMVSLGMDNAINTDAGGSSAVYYKGLYRRGPGRDVPNALVFIEQ
jgi:exopolysaccharide biosynthesis protein